MSLMKYRVKSVLRLLSKQLCIDLNNRSCRVGLHVIAMGNTALYHFGQRKQNKVLFYRLDGGYFGNEKI